MSTHARPEDILLEAGTNELEVLVFRLQGTWCGVNVAKVREVIRAVRPTRSPRQHPSLEGMFNMRGMVIPLVNLRRHLALEGTEADAAAQRVIITEFNALRVGFLVDMVEQIHRMSWARVRPAPDLSSLGGAGSSATLSICTGIIELGDRLVLMLDFESVADAILMEERLHVDRIDNPLGVDRGSRRVVLVEDSPFMRALMTRVLRESGYAQLEVYADGQEAWEAIEGSARPGQRPIDAVISDIEMPRMDGLHLTRRIKEHPSLSRVPVVLFSSLISEDNRKKGEQVGADVQIPKPQLREMVHLVDRVCSGQRVGIAQAA